MDFFQLSRILQFGDKDYFDIPINKQIDYISCLKQPKDDIERSYCQYLCQCFFSPSWKIFLFNIVATILFVPILLSFLVKRFFEYGEERIDAYGEFKGIEEIIPNELKELYNIEVREWKHKKSLSFKDLWLVCGLLTHHPLSPMFILKCTIKIASYSFIINYYKPRAIVVHNEPSYTNSVLTLFCERNKVQHINVMHGEKLFNIRDSFFRFSSFYVWSDYYIELFKSLRVEEQQMIVAIPMSLKIDVIRFFNKNVYSDFKYYLAIFNESEIKSIVESMTFVKKQGYTIKFRPHPRYSDFALLRRYVDSSEIEAPGDVSILESVSSLKFAVGSYTTVLTQAYYSGKGVVLDDVTYKNRYHKLKGFKYILSNVGLPTLSQFQNKTINS